VIEGPSAMAGFFRLSAQNSQNQRVDVAAVCHMIRILKTLSIEEAKARLTELVDEVEKGEIIVVTRDGHPIFDIVRHHWQGQRLPSNPW
jgi:hypothetical protein